MSKPTKKFNIWMSALLVGILLLTGCTGSKSVSIQVPEPDYWPTSGWRTSMPEAQGMDSKPLTDMLENISSTQTNIHSVVVIRNAYVVTEAYFHPYTADTRMHIQSVTKSVISMLVGKAIEDGYIRSENEKLADFYPNRVYANHSEEKNAIQLKHLLSMSSGLDCPIFDFSRPTMEQSQGWVQFVLDLPVVNEPGTEFGYNNCNPHLLSSILEKATGTSAREYANQEIFKPLGIAPITEGDWWNDPQKITNGGYGLHLQPLDMAKLGLLYLQNGRWDGQQIVPEKWVKASTTPYVQKEDGHSYGYLWTIYPEDEHYAALGLGGQQIHVYPSQNLVVVVTASLNAMAGTPEIDTLLNEYILPAVKSEQALAANPDQTSRLESAIESAAHPVQPVSPLPKAALENSGHPYTLVENPFGWKTMEFLFKQDQDVAQVLLDGVTLQVGLDNIYRSSITVEGYEMLLRGRWVDGQTFVIHYPYPLVGMMVLGELGEAEFQFRFTGTKLEVTAEELIFGGEPIVLEGAR